MFKILTYVYSPNIYFSRKVENACRRDINFMWLLLLTGIIAKKLFWDKITCDEVGSDEKTREINLKKEIVHFPEGRTAYKWLIYRLFERLQPVLHGANKTLTNAIL